MKRSSLAWLAFASLLAAWSLPVHGARPRYGGTLRVEIQSVSLELDPAASPADPLAALDQARVLPLVFETLVGVDATGRLVPRLATSWVRNDGATRWEFRLREGVRFHDGSPLDAASAAAALRRLRRGWTPRDEAGTLVIETPDGAEGLERELADPHLALALAGGDSGVVGTGPFALERQATGRSAPRLRASDAYWGGRPFLDAIELTTGRRPRDQVADLEQGRADLVSLLPQDARRLAQRGLKVVATSPLELVAIVLDPSRPAAASGELRRGLALAIDRQAICNVLLQRQGEPAHALLPQWLGGYAFLMRAEEDRAAARVAVQALSASARTIRAQADPADAIARAIAERVVVDARDAGLTILLSPPRGESAAPDARFVRRPVSISSPDRLAASLVAGLGADGLPDRPRDAAAAGSTLETQVRREQWLIDQHYVVPLVHLPELYGLSQRVVARTGSIADLAGAWRLADVWLRAERP